MRRFTQYSIVVLLTATAVGCNSTATLPHSDETETATAERQWGVAWVDQSAEFEALARQTYAEAGRDLDGLLANTAFSALPSQRDASQLPPAVILDVDETVVSNIGFQLVYERPFANWKLDKWNRENTARAIPGVREFVEKARSKGITVFFVTNRPCEPEDGEACPQQTTTLEDIAEVGIDTNDEHLLLADERPEWTREKSVRRELIARTHRIIMLIGDDLGDFIPCVRTTAALPCTESATKASRLKLVEAHQDYWGNGWYVLANPVHGSWTSALD